MKHRASLAVLSLLTLLPVAQANDVTPATGSKSMSFAQLAADAGAHPGVSATPTPVAMRQSTRRAAGSSVMRQWECPP